MLLILFCSSVCAQEPVEYVNPFIGTANGGNTLPGAIVPWGMAYISPHTDTTHKWSGARYLSQNESFFGFGQNHLSGVGCADFANLVITPICHKNFSKRTLTISRQKAEPGYYRCTLSNGVSAEITASERTTLSKFNYVKDSMQNIYLDISAGASPSKDSYVQINGDKEIIGYNKAGGFCYNDNSYTLYFVIHFNKEILTYGTGKNLQIKENTTTEQGTKVGAYVSFGTDPIPLFVKIGLSYVSIENARLNLLTEQPDFNFDRLRKSATEKWNRELSKIDISDPNEENKTIFYSALYHCLIHPNIIDDVNGEYPAMKTKNVEKVDSGHHHYTVFSLWDTYRTLHPLLTLVYPERQTDMVRTMVNMAKQGGDLPFWELGADESYVMSGDPAAIVVSDTYIKGLTQFDTIFAIQTMLSTANRKTENKIRPLNKFYLKYGYIPWDDCGPDDGWGKPRMVAECLEYAYADWAVAQMAERLGYQKEAESLLERSKAYNYYFNPDNNFIQPRYANGDWYEPFKPFGSHMVSMPGFVEGNSWQYTFFVPHDIPGLIKLMGGENNFTDKLQTCFDSSYFTIRNEPDIAYPFLFSTIEGEEWRTTKEVHKILKNEFNATAAGLPGNDDAGTISAWYVLASMGLYPDCPGSPSYTLSQPFFHHIKININSTYYPGKSINIYGSGEKKFRVKFNNEFLDKPFILHARLVHGGSLEFH